MAISATTAEDTWFNGHKTRLGGFGGGIYAASGSNIVDIIDADAVVGAACTASTATKLVRHGGQFRDASNGNDSDADDTADVDEEVICDHHQADEEYYGRRLLLSALSAAAVVPARRAELPSADKWPFRRKKSHLFKRKRRPSLTNVVEIYEHGPAPAVSDGDNGAVFSECKRRGGDVVQKAKTCRDSSGSVPASASSVTGACTEADTADCEFVVAKDATSLISGASATNVKSVESKSDGKSVRDSETNGCSSVTTIKNRSKSWYGEVCEKFQATNGPVFSNVNGEDGGGAGGGSSGKSNVNYVWSRRRTCSSLPEDEDGAGEIGVDSEERVVLLQRSVSVPDDDALSTPPAKRTTKATSTSTTRLDNIDDTYNSVSVLSSSAQQPAATSTTASTTMTSTAIKLGRWSKSKIDLKVPSLRSLVTMATNKLSASRPANLNYWRNGGGGCNGANNCSSSSRFDVRAPLAATLRRNISLNNVASKPLSTADDLKNASSNDIAEMCLLNKKLRKCNTVLTLSGCVGRSSSCGPGVVHVEPLRPVNRLRVSPSGQEQSLATSRMCSRCSSLLSMASSSRYSLNSTYGFVPVSAPTVLCKVCLNEVALKDSWTLQHCECSYCVDCVRSYVEFEINQGAYSISCPDAQCDKQGIILLEEIESLVSLEYIEKHKRYRLNREVELDKSRTWCPRAGCETVCTLCSTDRCMPQSVHCPTCDMDFCSNCRASWHTDSPCKSEEAVPGVTFDSELIKCCPMCSVPIEKDEGCAQMLCKRCKHVFCWYCLASLDDDFLLRHYDKGPCKNKLGHSRASVIWHRTQVISIFAGFGILLLIASPLLLLAAPCIVCCKCRVCTSDSKLDADDDLPEAAELHPNSDVPDISDVTHVADVVDVSTQKDDTDDPQEVPS